VAGKSVIADLRRARIEPVPLLLLRLARLERCGVWLPWIGLSSAAFVIFEVLSADLQLPWQVHGAYVVALTGIVLIYGGLPWALAKLVRLGPYFGTALDGDPEKTQKTIEQRLRRYVAPRLSFAGAFFGGLVIAAAVYSFCHDFFDLPGPVDFVFFTAVLVSAAGVGFGVVAMIGGIRLAWYVREIGARDFFVMHSLQIIGTVFLKISWYCLLIYLNYLAYLVIARSQGVPLTLAVNVIAAAIGMVMLCLTVWPQFVIFAEMRRQKLMALQRLQEELKTGDPTDPNHYRNRISLFHSMCTITAQPDVWRKIGVVGTLCGGYLLPITKYLYSNEEVKTGIQRLLELL
jgi:hypothetical protein